MSNKQHGVLKSSCPVEDNQSALYVGLSREVKKVRAGHRIVYTNLVKFMAFGLDYNVVKEG